MAFLAETKVLTTKGWKNISEVGGHDRVLVRNFLGDAQFVQPFAIKKREYSGPAIRAGSTKYKFTVTPEHTVVYKNKNGDMIQSTATEVPAKRENRLKHRSRYSTDTYLRPQIIKGDGFEYQVDTLDWYKLVGYVLRRGKIEKRRDRLVLMLDKKNPQKDMELICPILQNMRLQWTFIKPDTINLYRNTNIANKLAVMLGSRIRKNMYIPDKMVYGATLEEARGLIEMFVRTSRQDGTFDGSVQFSTSNVKLIDSLEILGLLSGYTISNILARKAGSKVPRGVTKRDTYVVYIRKSVNEFSVITKEELNYNGKVYELDIFEDQVLIKDNECQPVWMKPK